MKILLSCCVAVCLAILVSGNTDLYLNVTDVVDSSTPVVSACYPAATVSCNIRSAWEACAQISNNITRCIINLPADEKMSFEFGQLVLYDTNNIEIVGDNSTIFLDASSSPSRAFYYSSGYSGEEASLAISNVEISGFGDDTLSGGSMYLSGNCSLTLSNVIIKDSIAENGGVLVSSNSNPVYIENCTFIDSSAEYGGGIFVEYVANFIVVNSSFDNCVASCSYSQCSGGAIYINTESSGSLVDLMINGCWASENGGGLYIGTSNNNMTGSGISISNSTAGYGGGGGMYIGDSNDNMELSDVTISGCSSSSSGGGLYIGTSNNNMTGSGISISNSSSAGYGGGGGIYVGNNNENLDLLNFSIDNCTSTSQAGGIYISSGNDMLSFRNGVISHCSTSSSYGSGGGVYLSSLSYLTWVNVAISNCVSNSGGGVYVGSDTSNLMWTGVAISNCSAIGVADDSSYGGGVFFSTSNTNLVWSSVSVRDCVAIGDYAEGGGVYVDMENNYLSWTDVTISGCRSDSGGGVSVYEANNDMMWSNVVISDCYATSSSAAGGGGVYLYDLNNDMVWKDVTISNCHSAGVGGGVSVYQNNDDMLFSGLNVTNCDAAADGGGIYSNGNNPNFQLLNSSFYGCSSGGNGGGMSIGTGHDDLVIFNITLTECSAGGSGGGIFINEANLSPQVLDSEFINCIADNSGGGLYVGNGNDYGSITATMSGCRALKDGGAMYLDKYNVGVQASMALTNCVASGDGGGVYVGFNNTDAIITGSMTGCTAGGSGGAIYSLRYNTNMNLQYLSIYGCSAGSGGGGLFLSTSSYMNVNAVNLESCSSHSKGGAMYVEGLNHMTISSVNIVSCLASDRGGGIYGSANTNAVLTNMSISDCSCSILNGGGIAMDAGHNNISISNATLFNCSGVSGGGIDINGVNSNIVLYDTAIRGCSATGAFNGYGGGLRVDKGNSDVKVMECIFQNNSAYSGGGVYISDECSNVILGGCEWTQNSASYGGGVFLSSNIPNFVLMDSIGSQESVTLQTSHPYSTTNTDNIYFSSTVSTPGSVGYVLNFDPQTEWGVNDTFTIYDNDLDRNVLYFHAYGDSYPGVNLPSLEIDVSSFYVELVGHPYNASTWNNTELYGFLLYVYPLIGTSTVPSSFVSNTASVNGGGVHCGTAVLFPLIANAFFSSNTAGVSGGGISYNGDNLGAFHHSVVFEENDSMEDGGAVSFGYAHNGVVFKSCEFVGNGAAATGGAVALSSYNGVGNGLLTSGNEMTFLNNLFYNNTAAYGGALGADEFNVFAFTNCSLDNNKATDSGGGVWMSHYSIAANVDSEYTSNSAVSCGGGLTASDHSSVYMTNSSLTSNIAQVSGGGLCMLSSSNLIATGGVVRIANNSASQGGGTAILSSPMFEVSTSNQTDLYITSNSADLGSAVFFNNPDYDSTNETLSNVTISDNVAGTGGTVFWIFDASSGSKTPIDPDSDGITWDNNVAPYGPLVATQAVNLVGPEEYQVNDYNAYLSPAITLSMYDYYLQYIESAQASVSVSITNALDTSSCFGRVPYLSGNDLVGKGVAFGNGSAIFDELSVVCAPNGNLSLTFVANLGSEAGVSSNVAGEYYINTSVILSFRSCGAGEFDSEGSCTTCPSGSYNVAVSDSNDAECTDCTQMEGVQSCMGDELVLKGGYWRRYNTTTAVVKCPEQLNGCLGGNLTGEESCDIGYEGPLCSVCSDGYFDNSGTCSPCSEESSSSDVVVLIVIASIAVVGMAIYTYFHSGEEDDDDASESSDATSNSMKDTDSDAESTTSSKKMKSLKLTKEAKAALSVRYKEFIGVAKILMATYQVASVTASTMAVRLPSNITAVFAALQIINLNFSRIFMGCSQKYSFIEEMYVTTLTPIAISIFLGLCFWLEYGYKKRMLSIRNRGDGVDRTESAYKETRLKYLNIFFFITYAVLPSVTSTIFQMFLCTNVDPNNEDNDPSDLYLSADMNISCTSAYYYDGVAYASVMILVYPVGIPLMYLGLLYSRKAEIMGRDGGYMPAQTADAFETVENPIAVDSGDVELSSMSKEKRGNDDKAPKDIEEGTGDIDASHANKKAVGSQNNGETQSKNEEKPNDLPLLSAEVILLSFLWDSYLPKYWYWEVMETTRRLVLTSVLAVCGPGTSSQAVFAILLSLMYIKIYSYTTPYASNSSNVLAETGQFQIFFTFFGGLIIGNSLIGSAYNSLLGWFLIIINSSVVVLAWFHFKK